MNNKNGLEYLNFTSNRESIFYELPDKKINDKQKFIIPKFDTDEWYTYSDQHWTYMMSKNSEFPIQGWKIHITAHYNETEMLLYEVSEYLLRHKISFKYVANQNIWLEKNKKYADRSASGKFITIYPSEREIFLQLLDDLMNITKKFDSGPYILNDCQWKKSNVFFRYGGFQRINTTIQGKKVLAIYNDKGKLVEDQRKPYYYVPEFVEEPEFVIMNNQYPDQSQFIELKNYNFINSLHFSNAGGVYLAKRDDGKQIVIKEGRKGAGIDAEKVDGYDRISNEYKILNYLKNVSGVVNVYKSFTAWNHNYLEEDYIEGKNLQEYIASEFPYSDNEEVAIYKQNTISIIEQLESTIELIHNKGIAICDLSLTNILVTKKESKVVLIDFEAASFLNNSYTPVMATPGFISRESENNLQADWFAFYRIVLSLFLPVSPIEDLSDNFLSSQMKRIGSKFGDDIIKYLYEIEKKISKYCNVHPKPFFTDKKLTPLAEELSIENIPEIITKLANGIEKNLNYESFNLLKGNIYKLDGDLEKFNIAHGAFGGLLALLETGNIDYIHEELESWLKFVIPFLEKQIDNEEIDFGLFSGMCGIVNVLYKLGFKIESTRLMDKALIKLNQNYIEEFEDVSLYSGLSGIGISLISYYKIQKNEHYKDIIIQIFKRIQHIGKNMLETENKDIDFGLISGWSGVGLFIYHFNKYIENKTFDLTIIDIFNKANSNINSDKELQNVPILEYSENGVIKNPYLADGGSGLALLMLYLNEKKYISFNTTNKEILDSYLSSNSIFCTYNGGLFKGYAGLLPLSFKVSQTSNNFEIIQDQIDKMNLYLLEDEDSYIYVPGDFGYKVSLDIASGSAGLILVLNDILKNNNFSWIPLIDTVSF